MILTCPSCSSRFLVDDAVIPEEGREVRCASCGHQWFVRPEADAAELKPAEEADVPADEEAAAESSEEIVTFDNDDSGSDDVEFEMPDIDFGGSASDDSEEDKAVSTKPLMLGAVVLILAIIVTSLVTFRSSLQPSLGFIYNIMGLYAVDGLVLADVEMRERPSKSKARYVVEGKIINEASEPRHIPILRVMIVSKDGDVMMTREYEADGDDKMLEPGESYPFKAGRLETAFKDKVDHLLVDIGSGTELMLRDGP